MIQFIYDTSGITPSMVEGFFVDWPSHPDPAAHIQLLQQSSYIVLAIDEDASQVVGFITAISDGVLSAYIPLLEVLPAYRNRGIGNELVERMKKQLSHLYMVDLGCDDDLVPYYEKHGMFKTNAMILRNYGAQAGHSTS
ncbi:GNAT family N-acetyltransferase [Alkalihalobacillus sp. FSL R5-0424]